MRTTGRSVPTVSTPISPTSCWCLSMVERCTRRSMAVFCGTCRTACSRTSSGSRSSADPAAPPPQTRLPERGAFDGGEEAAPPPGGAVRGGGNFRGGGTQEPRGGASMTLPLSSAPPPLPHPFPASPAAPPFFSGFPAASLKDDLDTYDLDFQYHFSWSARHKVAWGLAYRATRESDEDLSIVRFTPAVLNQSLYSGFAQDEIMLARRVYLTVGSKLEHNDYSGFEFEPSDRLQWHPESTQLLWGAISRAVRTPSRYDRDLLVPSGRLNAPPPFQFPTT